MDAKEYIKLLPEEKLMGAIFGLSLHPSYLKELNGVTLRKTMESLLSTLSPREERILQIRYGFQNRDSEEGVVHTLEQTGKIFDVTRERIRQIEGKALRRLRHWTRSRVLKPYIQTGGD